MKRSEINIIVEDTERFIGECRHLLPPFAAWGVNEMQQKAKAGEIDDLIASRRGWDVTDFGSGDFQKTGMASFVLRNGRPGEPSRSPVTYSEKLTVIQGGQVVPMHRHERKTKDLVNRGGGVLAIKLYLANEDGSVNNRASFDMLCDGHWKHCSGGDIVWLRPGESITIDPGIWHSYWSQNNNVLVGEIATSSDDGNDDVFADKARRFPSIQEDKPATRLLVGDYSQLKKDE